MRTFERLDAATTRRSVSVSVHGKTPANQAYVDLLKASWILYDIILREENITSLQTDENRKLFYNLSDVKSSPSTYRFTSLQYFRALATSSVCINQLTLWRRKR